MKTNYLQRNNPRKANFKNAIIVIAVFILGFLILSIFKTGFLYSMSPLWNLRQSILVETNDLFTFFRSKDALIEENKILRQRLDSQESLLISFNALNQSYSELLKNISNSSAEEKIAAGILTTPPQSPYDVLIIDVGKDNGVVVGSLVTLPFGALVGTVTGTTARTAQVTLFSSYGAKTEALLERSQTPVTLTGQGGGNFVIRVPRDIEVLKGDRVLSLGLNSRFLGVIEDVSALSTDSFKRVVVQIPGGIFGIRFLYVLK